MDGIRDIWGAVVVSHPFAEKPANGWGTGHIAPACAEASGHEDVQADVPFGALARLQGDHPGVHVSPYFAEWIGEVELVFDCREVLVGRGVHLDGADFRRAAFDVDTVMGGRIDYLSGDDAVLPLEMAPVVVVKVFGEGASAGNVEVILARDGNELA